MIKPICPHCEVSLERRSNAGVFQYFCPSCFGFSISFGGLKKILSPTVVSRLWRDAETAPKSQTKCSHCLQAMCEVFHVDGTRNIELDVCCYCNLVWLDTGEWKDLEKSGKTHVVTAGERASYKQYADALIELDKIKKDNLLPAKAVDVSHLTGVQAAMAFVGLPVEAEEDRLNATPWITWLLIWLCVMAAFITFKRPDVYKEWGYLGGLGFPQNFVRAISSFFLHGGWIHLLSNMYFLWVFGDNVEDHLGKLKYVLLVLFATLIGNAAYSTLDPRAMTVPAVGASGGIFGVVTYYMIRYPSRRFVMAWRFLFLPRYFNVPAYLLGCLFLFKEVIGAVLQHSGRGTVSSLSHLGGALVGLMFALIYAPKIEAAKDVVK